MRFATIAALLTASVLAGCAGSAVPSSRPGPQAAVVPHEAATVTFTIRIAAPGGTSNAERRARYISYSTKSLQINIDPGTSGEHDRSFDLTTQAGYCAPSGVLGVLLCTFPLTIAPGAHTATVIAYDATGGTAGGGKALSASYGLPFTVVTGVANTPTFTLAGITKSFVLVPLDTTAVRGDGITTPISFTSSAATQFLVEALDADKNPIIGPGSPTLAVTNGNAAALSVSQSTSNPYQFQIQPIGTSASAMSVTFAAPDTTGQGGAATSFSATFAPTFTPVLACASGTCVNGATSADAVTVAESGYSGSFTFTNSAPAKCTIGTTTSTSAVITSTASSGNTCTITATDRSSRTGAAQLSFPSVMTQSVDGVNYGSGPATVTINCVGSTCSGTTTWVVTDTNPNYLATLGWNAGSIVMTQGGGLDACQAYNGGLLINLAYYSFTVALMPPGTPTPAIFPYRMPASQPDQGTCRGTLQDGFGGTLTVYFHASAS